MKYLGYCCQNPNLTSTKPNLNLVGFDTIIAAHCLTFGTETSINKCEKPKILIQTWLNKIKWAVFTNLGYVNLHKRVENNMFQKNVPPKIVKFKDVP